MKKLVMILVLAATLVSCGDTSTTQDLQMLQTKYPTSIIYRINTHNYTICDSTHVYHIEVTDNGEIFTTIKIK